MNEIDDRDPRARRRYESPARRAGAARTRRAIVGAAHDLFVTRGYVGTSIRAVAEASGVSVATVELVFGTKARLLAAVVDVARAGDDLEVPLLDRPAARAAMAADGIGEFLAAATAEIAAVAARAAAILTVVAAAAGADDVVRALAEEIDTQRRAVAGWLVEGMATRAVLRETDERAVDVVWTVLDPVVHRRLVGDCGWTTSAFAAWLRDGLARLLVV